MVECDDDGSVMQNAHTHTHTRSHDADTREHRPDTRLDWSRGRVDVGMWCAGVVGAENYLE